MSLPPIDRHIYYAHAQTWYSDESCAQPIIQDTSGFAIILEDGYLSSINNIENATTSAIIEKKDCPVGLRYSHKFMLNDMRVWIKDTLTPWESTKIYKLTFAIPVQKELTKSQKIIFEHHILKELAYEPKSQEVHHYGFRAKNEYVEFEIIMHPCSVDTAQSLQVKLFNLLLLGLPTCGTPINTVYYTQSNEYVFQFERPQFWTRRVCHLDMSSIDITLPSLINKLPVWMEKYELSLWRDVVRTSASHKCKDLRKHISLETQIYYGKEIFDVVFDFFEVSVRMIAEKRVWNITQALHHIESSAIGTTEMIKRTLPKNLQMKLIALFPLKTKAEDTPLSDLNKFMRILAILRNKSHHTFLSDEVQCRNTEQVNDTERIAISEFLMNVAWAICMHDILEQPANWTTVLHYDPDQI